MDCLRWKRLYRTITLGYCFQNIIGTHQGEALEHVLDVAADGSHGGDLLLLAKPFLDLQGQNEEESPNIKDLTNTHLNGLGISHIDVDCKMLELLTMEIVRALQLLHVRKVWVDYA